MKSVLEVLAGEVSDFAERTEDDPDIGGYNGTFRAWATAIETYRRASAEQLPPRVQIAAQLLAPALSTPGAFTREQIAHPGVKEGIIAMCLDSADALLAAHEATPTPAGKDGAK